MTSLLETNSPGFQGSERSGCEAVIYRQGTDAIIQADGDGGSGPYPLTGKTAHDDQPSIISVQIQKSMGAAGQFSLQLKAPASNPDLFSEALDDDWIDIYLTCGKTKYHVMRGMIDEVRRDYTVGGTGATVATYTLVGRDFQKVYEQTPIWFSRYTGENVCGAAAYQVVQAENLGGNVADTVGLFLQGFLSQAGDKGRANFTMPSGMPGVSGDFVSTVQFDTSNYSDIPSRTSVSSTLMMPEGAAWDLAKEWADPMFCELFTELYTLDGSSGGNGTDPSTTVMRTVLRDKPFPMVDAAIGAAGLLVGLASQWFELVTYTIPRQRLVATNVGRSGYERVNAFFVSPQLIQELEKSTLVDLTKPLWNPADMVAHGMRRMDVVSRYFGSGTQLVTLSDVQRRMARDWYCMNAYWLNGTLAFGSGHPEIRIGCRLRIPGVTGPKDDETYYIEGYTHTWGVQQGMRTTAVVTRGWRGTDAELVSTLTQIVAGYHVAQAGG